MGQMQKLITFYRTFWKSVSSFSYYRDVVAAPFSFSIKYFLMFSLLLGIILTTGVSLLILPPVDNFLTRLKERTSTLYPPDVTITLKDGQLSTNTVGPLRFPIPYELLTDVPPAVSDQNQVYLLTIDANAQIEDYKKSQSLIFVTKNSVVVTDARDETRIYDLKEFGDIVVNKEAVDRITGQILPYLKFIPFVIVIVLALVFILLLTLIRALSLVFLTLILLPIARLMHLNFSPAKLYQIGLHAHTLPTLIQTLMLTFGLLVPVPFFGSLLFLLYTLVILAELRKPPTEQVEKAAKVE